MSRGLSTFVGRERELEMMERGLAEGRSDLRVIDLAAGPGMGKSRLIYEFHQRIGGESTFVLSGNCSPDGQQTPFLPFIEVMRGSFRISAQTFIKKLERELPNIKIPKDAWWAFDYHLDWLFAVLAFAPEYQLNFDPRPNPVADFGDKYIRGTQEDCDFIIAFDSTIILIEAKVGGSWSNEQLWSKVQRLKRVPNSENPKIYFVLASPKRQKGKIKTDGWPDWVFGNREKREPFRIDLNLRESAKDWVRVTRCDNDKDGTSNADGEFWRLCEAGQ